MTAIVCMATCNGAAWVQEQVDSILQQDWGDWCLLVSDDGSSDGTLQLLEAAACRDARIEILARKTGSPAAVANFEYLLGEARRRVSSEDFIVLCDQDDVWLPGKLRGQAAALRRSMGACFDPMLADAGGNPIGRALFADRKFAERLTPQGLLAQNRVVGCTLAIRPEVLELALPFPEELQNHDWWLGLCVVAMGPMGVVSDSPLLYRQHGKNAIGAFRPSGQLRRIPVLLRRQRAVMTSQVEAAAVLAERIRERSGEPPAVLDAYVNALTSSSGLRRSLALGFGAFAAPFLPLRLLRALAALGPDWGR